MIFNKMKFTFKHINFSLYFIILSCFFSQNMTPPNIPEILGVGGDETVTVTWNRLSEASIDSLTGYSDFEGYRLYRSTDGGITWGDIETDIIPKDGQIVGWRPIQQFDLNENQDLERCVYLNDYGNKCVDNPDTPEDESLMRSTDISGADPVAPWFYLGDNTSLNHSFVDTDVINGVEYTYAITAFDMGVKIDTVVINNIDGNISLDTTWNISNPGQFSCPGGWGLESKYNQCPSFESPKLSESFTDYNSNGTWDEGEPWHDLNGDGIWNPIRENLINVVTVTPSKSASDISFPDTENTETFILASSSNIGTGNATYRFVDEGALEPALVKFEIQADRDYDNDGGITDNDGDFEDFSTRNPGIYAYRINDDESLYQGFYAEYNVSDLSVEDLELYLDMPGASYSEDEESIYIPNYYIENHPVSFSNISGYQNNFTDWFNGVQFRFDNYWSELPQTNSFATLDTIEFYSADGSYNPVLATTFSNVEIDYDLDGIIDFDYDYGDVELAFWNEGFSNRAMFDYKIEFSTNSYIDTAFRNFPNDDYCLDVSIGNSDWDGRDQVSFLPFKITNLTTGRQVRIWHTDEGVYNAEDVGGQLEGITQSMVPGYTDCIWQPNELLSFAYDSLAYADDITDVDDHKTFQLGLQYDLNQVRGIYGQPIIQDGFEEYFDFFDFWQSGNNYEQGQIVEVVNIVPQFGATGISGIYQAKREIIDSLEVYPNFCGGTCPPNAVYDNDGDNLNDNPWQQLYPWEEGDYLIVRPDKWFNDGDSWIVDLSLIGKKETLTTNMLDSVTVVPNPYVVSSQYNEEVYGNRLLFDKLPKNCTIKIFTVTGELVETLVHGGDNNLSGSIPWDLKNSDGELVYPGLYFYTVEADGVNDNKIGKFVIVR